MSSFINFFLGMIFGYVLVFVYPYLYDLSIKKRLKLNSLIKGGGTSLWCSTQILLMQLLMILTIFMLVAGPVILGKEYFQLKGTSLQIFYLLGLTFIFILNFNKFTNLKNKFYKEYLITCPKCGATNERPQFEGQKRELFTYYTLAVKEKNDLLCSKCNSVLEK